MYIIVYGEQYGLAKTWQYIDLSSEANVFLKLF